MNTSDPFPSIGPLESTETREHVAIVGEQSFEDLVERFTLPSPVFKFVLHRGTDPDLLVGGTHSALMLASTRHVASGENAG
jgi:hypothetical protein